MVSRAWFAWPFRTSRAIVAGREVDPDRTGDEDAVAHHHRPSVAGQLLVGRAREDVGSGVTRGHRLFSQNMCISLIRSNGPPDPVRSADSWPWPAGPGAGPFFRGSRRPLRKEPASGRLLRRRPWSRVSAVSAWSVPSPPAGHFRAAWEQGAGERTAPGCPGTSHVRNGGPFLMLAGPGGTLIPTVNCRAS